MTGTEPVRQQLDPHGEIAMGTAGGVRETAYLAARKTPFIVAPGIETDGKAFAR